MSGSSKFQRGERVRMTTKAREQLGRALARGGRRGDRGVVVRQHRDRFELWRIHRDGYSENTVEYFHESFWELDT